ncbi:C-type lectin domain family 12 member B-like [Protopterus annectens]|uniref:C-type lectin domain family 12 member B-like n=1 Tax=Protopterus annectens TaxID=7888 RepID=UPI001CFB3973|nr:C-type lectin domain family 12 member B-like [Protopterus annectens]
MEPEQTYEELIFTSEDSYKVLECRQKNNARTQMVVESGEVHGDKDQLNKGCTKPLITLIGTIVTLLVVVIILIILTIQMSQQIIQCNNDKTVLIKEIERIKNETIMPNCETSTSEHPELTTKPTATTQAHSTTCSWKDEERFQNSCYFFNHDLHDVWFGSRKKCKERNSDLVVINSREEESLFVLGTARHYR